MKQLTKNNTCLVDGTNPLTKFINTAIASGKISSSDGNIFSKRLLEASCGKIVLNEHDEKIYNEITKGFGFDQSFKSEFKSENLNTIFNNIEFEKTFFNYIETKNIEELKKLDSRKYDIKDYPHEKIEKIVRNTQMLQYFLNDPNYINQNKYLLHVFVEASYEHCLSTHWSYNLYQIINHPVFKQNIQNINFKEILLSNSPCGIKHLLPFIKDEEILLSIDNFKPQFINNMIEYYSEKNNLKMVKILLPLATILEPSCLWNSLMKDYNIEIMKLILNYTKNSKNDIYNCFTQICKKGLLEQAQLLLPYIDEIQEMDNDIFCVLVKNNDLNMIKLLFNSQFVQKGLIYYTNLVMNEAMKYKKKEIIEFLSGDLGNKDVPIIINISLLQKYFNLKSSL